MRARVYQQVSPARVVHGGVPLARAGHVRFVAEDAQERETKVKKEGALTSRCASFRTPKVKVSALHASFEPESRITSPMGHGILKITALTPSHLIKRQVGDWRQQSGI